MKKNIILYVVILLLACGLTGAVTYIVMDKQNNKDEVKENKNDNNQDNDIKEPVVLEDGVKLKKAYELNDNIVEEFEVILNGKIKTLKVLFHYEYDEFYNVHYLIGMYNDYVFLERKYYDKEENSLASILNIKNVKELFNENNFKILKGEDNKNYLLAFSTRDADNVLYIYNENLEIVENKGKEIYEPAYCEEGIKCEGGFMLTNFYFIPCEFENNIDPWYKNTFEESLFSTSEIDDMDFSVKIEENKIYYLAGMSYDENLESSYVEERVYTINNNELSYKVINTYKAKGVCQQM